MFYVYSISLCYSCVSAKNNPVKLIESKYPQIFEILDKIYRSNEKQYDWDKTVFVLNINKVNDDINLRITVVYKQDFRGSLRDRKDKVYGYFEFNKYPVLVFGDGASDLFSKTDKAMEFDWFRQLPPQKKASDNEIQEPPGIFEPEVWLYKFKNGKFEFSKKGYYDILD
ncbi:MAG: Uncharacterized protein JWM14_2030 [Chitinophagaceae bacterium]|nr:Uncharacterized protein [Chitinophagaceae bacterium]